MKIILQPDGTISLNVDVAVQRWQALTGEQATLEDDGRTFEQMAQERRKKAA